MPRLNWLMRSMVGVALLLLSCASDDPAESQALAEATAPATASRTVPSSLASPPTPKPPRSGAPPVDTSPSELVLVAGGDINLGREQGQLILADPRYDPLRHVRPWLAGADLRFANLESQLSDQGGETQSPNHKLVFTGPPGGAEVLKTAGFDIVSLANNHAWDYQRRGFEETLANLERVGIAYTGVSRERGKHYEPTIVRVKGWSVAFFAVTHIWNAGRYSTHPGRFHVAWANWAQLAKPVEKAHKEHDLVIVSYHGGVEYRDTPYPPAARFIAAAMASGHVDVVLGHHPHVPRGIGWFGERPALYSLGNLVFGRRSDNRWERTSFLARLTFRQRADQRPATAVELCPYDLVGHSPHPFAGPGRDASRAELAAHLTAISTSLGGKSASGRPSRVNLGPSWHGRKSASAEEARRCTSVQDLDATHPRDDVSGCPSETGERAALAFRPPASWHGGADPSTSATAPGPPAETSRRGTALGAWSDDGCLHATAPAP